jgi:hypothetical protein
VLAITYPKADDRNNFVIERSHGNTEDKMLAEIFMLRMEANARQTQDQAVDKPRFVPFLPATAVSTNSVTRPR